MSLLGKKLAKSITLFHGTCPENAKALIADGWKPNQISPGGNMGQAKYLYLSTGYDDALWYAEEKGCNVILEVQVPKNYLEVDPEDGFGPTVDDELTTEERIGTPGKLVLTKPLPAANFKIVSHNMDYFSKDAKMHHNASTQIDVPGGAAATILDLGRELIADEMLAGDGRVETPHVTVKYGVREDEALLRQACAGFTPFTITLGKTQIFTPTEASGGVAPVVVEVHANQLPALHEAVGAAMGTFKDTMPYVPHITIAYVKPEEAQHFAGNDMFSGISFQATAITLSRMNDNDQVKIPLGKTAAAAPAPAIAPEIPPVRPPDLSRGVAPQYDEEGKVKRDEPAVQQPEVQEQPEPEQIEEEPEEQPEPEPQKPLPQSPKGWRAPKKPVPQTTNFKKWFGKSKVVNEDGAPMVVYHGTTHDIETFDINETNKENFYGRGIYFTDSQEDVAANYATESGPDITGRIERRAEELFNDLQEQWDDEHPGEEYPAYSSDPESHYQQQMTEAKNIAKKEIAGGSGGVTMPCYLSLQNPVIVQKQGGTEFSIDYDEETGEESGSGMALYNALNNVAGNWGVDAGEMWSEIMENGEFNAWDFEKKVRANDRLEDDEGMNNPGEFISEVYQEAGFDGIIQDAWAEFGARKQYGQPMTMDYGTKHYIVWDSNKIKSAIGNRGKFDPKNEAITAARKPKLTQPKPKAKPMPKTIVEDCWITPDMKWIDCSDADHDTIAAQLGFWGKDPRRDCMNAGYVRVVVWDHVQEAIMMFKDAADCQKKACTILKHLPVWVENVGIEAGLGKYTSYELAEAEERFCGGFSQQGSDDSWQVQWEDQQTLAPGTVLYHGTSSDWEEGDELQFPAWFSSDRKVAEHFAYGKVIRVYKVTAPITLPAIMDRRGMDEFCEMFNVEVAGAEAIADAMAQSGLPGWIIPNNYTPGDDILLTDGNDIQLDHVEPAGKSTYWKDNTAAQGTGDLSLANKIMHELFPMLGENNLPKPVIKVVNQPRAGWLGRDTWKIRLKNGEIGWDENTEIEVQKYILNDENTLRRIIAHELCHHADSLVNAVAELSKNKNFGEIGYKSFLRGQSGHGHGPTWRAYAAKYNAKYGADFVTEKSDESYVQEEMPINPYYIRLWKHPSGKIYYAVSTRFGPKIKKYLERKAVEPDPSERMTKTDSRLFMHGATIGDGWSMPQGKNVEEKEKLLKELWETAQPDKQAPLSPKTQDDLELMEKMRNWNLTRGTPTTASMHKKADYGEEVIYEYADALKSGNKNYRQKWEVVPAARLKKIWNDYAKTGFVRDEKGMEGIAALVLKNIYKLQVNTILCGHEQASPARYAEDFLETELPDDYFEQLEHFFDDDNGAWRISDYAMAPLMGEAHKLEECFDPEQQLQIVDRILNIVHARSDLSSWFVQGGFGTLNSLAGKTAGARANQVTSMTVGVNAENYPDFPQPVLIRWEQGMRWRQVLKVVKSVVGDVAGKRVAWRDIFIWASLWEDAESQQKGWEETKAKGARVMFDVLRNDTFVSVGKQYKAEQVGLGVTEAPDKEANYRGEPLSDTNFPVPELGTENNAYAMVPEKVMGDEIVPDLQTLAPQLFKSKLLNKQATGFPIPDAAEVIWMEDGLSGVIPDWSVIRKEVKERYPNLDPEDEKSPEVNKAMDEIGYEHALGMWAETEDRLRALKFPLTVYRAFGSVSPQEIGTNMYKDRGAGIYWSWDQNNAYVHKELASGHPHIVILRGVVQSPSDINVVMTAWKNLVAEDEREIEVLRGAKVTITGWKWKGETKWRKPLKNLQSVTAAYAEGQNQVQHTNHQTYGTSKALKSDPFSEETAQLHAWQKGVQQDSQENPQLPRERGEGFLPHADGEESLAVMQGGETKEASGPVDVNGDVYKHFKLTTELTWHESGDVVDEEYDWNAVTVRAYDTTKPGNTENGKFAGSVDFVVQGGHLISANTEIEDDYLRQGIATALYVYAERETGMTAEPHRMQSQEGREFWSQKDRPFGS